MHASCFRGARDRGATGMNRHERGAPGSSSGPAPIGGTLVASGLYVVDEAYRGGVMLATLADTWWEQHGTLYSPMPSMDRRGELYGMLRPRDARVKGSKPLIVAEGDLTDYAATIVALAVLQLQQNPAFVLCPLRGGTMPTRLLHVLRGSCAVHDVPYTHGASGEHDTIIAQALKTVLAGYAAPGAPVVFWIVDTSKSGLGAWHLAELLQWTVQKHFATTHWFASFHLLVEKRYSLRNHYAIRALSRERLIFDVVPHPIPSLLVEDRDAAIGIRIEYGRDEYSLQRVQGAGQVILRAERGETVLQSDDLAVLVNVLVGEAVNEAMRTDPQLAFRRDVWQEGSQTPR